MLLGLIISILTATYSLSSTNTVEQTGTAPNGSVAVYERTATTGQKGQMTAGNSTQLKLTGWAGCSIKRVELQMRSNSKAGAGSLTMTVGIDTLWHIENQTFDKKIWAGQYTTSWVPITKSMNARVGEEEMIEICISAIENSLYINSYTIYYELPIPQSYTVLFMTGLDSCPQSITQVAPDLPICLPQWQDTACWYFMGWSKKEIVENEAITTLLMPGDEYIPNKHITLWAVYSNTKELTPTKQYLSGRYVLAAHTAVTQELTGSGVAMCGTVTTDCVPMSHVLMQKNADSVYYLSSSISETMYYDLIFNEDSTLFIMHTETLAPIGYKANKLYEIECNWNYRILQDGSVAIYHLYNNKEYALYFGLPQDSFVAYSQNMNITKWNSDAWWLFPIQEIHYTSWPFGKYDAIPEVNYPSSTNDFVYRFGIYELHIRDGKKILYLKQ